MRIVFVKIFSRYNITMLIFTQLLLMSSQVLAIEKVSLQLSWKFQFEYAGFIMAKEKGFYKEAGLEVKLEEYSSGTDNVENVLSHRAEHIADGRQPRKVLIVKTGHQNGFFCYRSSFY